MGRTGKDEEVEEVEEVEDEVEVEASEMVAALIGASSLCLAASRLIQAFR